LTDILELTLVKYFTFLFLFFTFNTLASNTGEIRVAVFIEAPFAYIKNHQLAGENIEIAKLLAKSINLTPIFIQCPFVRCLAMVKNGQADMIFGLKKTPQRVKQLHFLAPAYLIQHVPLSFYTLKSKNLIIDKYEDLQTLSVGLLRGGTYFDKFDHDSNINKVELTSRMQLVKMLLRGRIDTFLEREESVKPLVSPKIYRQQLKLANYKYDKTVKGYIGVSKNAPISNYVEILSKNLQVFMTNGTIANLMENRPKIFPKNNK